MAGEQLEYPLLDDPRTSGAPSAPPSAPADTPACQCKAGCWCVVIYMVLQVLVIVLEILTLYSYHWLKYCFWNFGLRYGENDGTNSDYSESGLAFDLQTKYCLDDSAFWINQYCPAYCVNVYIVAVSGVVTLVLGVVAIFLALVPLVLHGFSMRGHLSVSYVNWLTLAPMVFWTLGWIVFFVGKSYLQADVDVDVPMGSENYPKTSIGSAFWLAIVGSVGQLLLFFYVHHCTRKAFTKVSS